MVSLEVDLAPSNPRELRLANPVIAASGCFGFGQEYAGVVDVRRLGAFVCKSITRRPRTGHPMPRTAETPAGVLHAIGLQNPGLRVFVRRYPPLWTEWGVPAIVSIAGERAADFAEIAAVLDEVPGIAGVEINLACPNLDAEGYCFGWDAATTQDVVAAVRGATTLPVIAKLPPGPAAVAEIAVAAEGAGADAISLINSVVGMAIDVKRRRPVLGVGSGGLSGPAIKPIALAMVGQAAAVVGVPVIGVGGITAVDDALEFLMAGATAIQVGSAIFADPGLLTRLVDDLEVWMRSNGVERIEDVVGAARHAQPSSDAWAVAAG
jgi:dihydroorotate dehydrogenase (NAD+) catalytic subunit